MKAVFPSFTAAVAKYKVRKTEEFVADGKAFLRLNPLGYLSTKIYFQVMALRPLMQDIVSRMPSGTDTAQPQIPISYNKILNLASSIKQMIDSTDSYFPQSLKNATHMKKIIDTIMPAQNNVMKFSDPKSGAARNIDSLTQTFNTAIGLVDQILANCVKFETALQGNLPACPASQQQMINTIASVLISYELFYIDLVCLLGIPQIQASKDLTAVTQNVIANIRAYADALFKSCHSDPSQFLQDSVSILSKFSILSSIISQMQQSLNTNYEFAKTTVSLITATQATNELVCKLQAKLLMDLMKNATASYLNKKPFEQSIQICKILLQMYQEKFTTNNNQFASLSSIAAYQSLLTMLDRCSSSTELAAYTILSTCRFLAANYPDARLSEDLLIALSQKISYITRQFHKECREINQNLIEIIESGLEYLPEKQLAELNFFMQAIKKNMTFNPDAEDFVLVQQSTFDMIAGIPTSLMKLIGECSDTQIQSSLTGILKKFQPLGTKYGLWLHLYQTSIASIIINRAESFHDILNYSLSLIMGKNQDLDMELVKIEALVNSIATILSSTPQNFTFDLLDVNKIVNQLQDLTDGGNDFIRVVQTMIGHPFYHILHVAAQCIVKIAAPLPIQAQCFCSLLNFDDKAVFQASLLSNISRALILAKDNELNAGNNDPSMLFFFAPAFTYMLMNDAVVATSGQNGAFLVQYSAPLRSSIDVFNGICTNICMQKKPPEAKHLPTYIQSIIKTNSDMYNAACAQPQPMIYYKMPENIKEVKKFEELAKNLPSSLLRNFAPEFARLMNKGNAPECKNAIANWLDAAKKGDSDLDKSIGNFIATCIKMYNAGKPDMKSFIPALNAFSVALALNENIYGRNIAPVMQQLHKRLIEEATNFMDDSNNMKNVMKMLATVAQFKAFPELSKLKLKDTDEYTNTDVRGIIKALHNLRSKGKQSSTDDLVNVLEALRNLEAFYDLYPNPSPLQTQPYIDMIVKGNPKRDEIDAAIKYFADRLNILVPLLYRSVDRIRDLDALIDLAYDKFDLFKAELANAISTTCGKGSMESLHNSLNNCIKAAADTAILANQGLNLRGISESQAAHDLVDDYAALQEGIIGFASDAVKAKKDKKGSESKMTAEGKNLTKIFDSLLNTVEKPNFNERGPASKFIGQQYKLYNSAANAACDLAYAVELASSSIVPEMFTDGCGEFNYKFGIDKDATSRNSQNVKNKAFGSTSTFSNNIDGFEKSSNAVTKALPNIKCGETTFPIDGISNQLSNAFTDIRKLVKSSSNLTDQSVLTPDPTNALKLPDDYILPAPPAKAPPLNQTWENLGKANSNLIDAISKFRKAVDAPAVSNEDLVAATIAFRKVADKFGDNGVAMTVATPDTRARVALQAALYTWGSNVTNVQNSIRSRLLRVPGYDEELKESIDNLINNMLRVMKLSDEASRIVATKDDAALDDVTRQLVATAREVDALMAQMNSMEDKVNPVDSAEGGGKKSKSSGNNGMDISKISAPTAKDINNPDWLAAFVVACSKIILKAASVIVARSRDITSKTIAKSGKVDNERGYIKAAHEISEAAKLLMIVADILVNGKDEEIEYKIIAAAKIINGAIATLVAVMGVKGSDAELKSQVKTVKETTDKLTRVVDRYINMKLDEKDKHEPKKSTNPMILRFNLQQQVNAQRKLLEEEEKRLYQFRKSFGKV